MRNQEPWQVELSPAAIRGLDRLPPRISGAIVEFVTSVLPGNPVQMSKPLRGHLADVRSARRGDYRILFSLDVEDRVILVVRVAHRAEVYRP